MKTVEANDFSATAQSALERMAFVFVEPSPELHGEVLAESHFHAQVEIVGEDGNTTLGVSATNEFICEVAGAMMGIDATEIDVDEHGPATVSELSNVLGGELIMAMGGGDSAMRLGLPRAVDDESAGQLADACAHGGQVVVLQSENGHVLIAWHEHR